MDPGPQWSTVREACRVVGHRTHLRRTLLTAVIVGTVLFAINQLDVVLAGDATTATWVKGAVTYVVPFCVANVGVLIASRRPGPAGGVPHPGQGGAVTPTTAAGARRHPARSERP